jgi:hypothetical protein
MTNDIGIGDRESYKQALLDVGVEISAILLQTQEAVASKEQEAAFFKNRNTSFD